MARDLIASLGDGTRVIGAGTRMELYKEVGRPDEVARQLRARATWPAPMRIGHTRMATESAVTTDGAHPFSTGRDQCLVHNGSLSNHNALRRELQPRRPDVRDRERYRGRRRLSHLAHARGRQPRRGARRQSLDDLDGFYTFVVGTEDRLRRAARSDRLQAGGDGRDRRLRRLRLRIPRACRPAGHRQGARCGSRSRRPSISGSA